jgi:6-pyruvoyltetrahydropterin/6-carboxytetrahydropterin synthase
MYTSTKIIELGSCAFRQWRATDTHCCKVHGYRLMAKFWFTGELDERNWVVHFGGLKELKAELQNQFDHTLCIASTDPLLPLFKELHEKGGCDLRVMDEVGIELTAEYCFKVASKHIETLTNGRARVVKVEVWEHEGNSAIFEF